MTVGLADAEIAFCPNIDLPIVPGRNQLEIEVESPPSTIKGGRHVMPLAILNWQAVLSDIVCPPIVQNAPTVPLTECVDLVLSSVHAPANKTTVGIPPLGLDPGLEGVMAPPQRQPG